jgi:hypothetical protein
LYNATGASVLIAGLFHATFNSTINPTGFALGVLRLPPEDAFTVLNAMGSSPEWSSSSRRGGA